MPRFSANLSMMFTEVAPLDRPAAARDAGLDAIEIQFPYDLGLDAFARAVERAGLPVAVFNIPVGDMLTGGPGLAAMPGREPAFRDAVAEARRFAEALQPRNVNVLTGFPPPEIDRAAAMATLARNLAHAGEALAPIGVRVTVEAVNSRDRPGYFLTRTEQALAALDQADHANVYLEYDVYHMQIMEGDLIPTLTRNLDRIGHIQFADTPGRHQPGTGEINFTNLFGALDDLGYAGFVGAEYVPTGTTLDSLDWLEAARDHGGI